MIRPLWCYSGGHHSAYRCITLLTFASADQWDPARLDSFGAASSAVAPNHMQPCCNPHRTAALKSTIRQQSAPTKPAFSDSSMATRCPADPPGWSWQDEGLRERWGWRQIPWWLSLLCRVQRDRKCIFFNHYILRAKSDPAFVALTVYFTLLSFEMTNNEDCIESRPPETLKA